VNDGEGDTTNGTIALAAHGVAKRYGRRILALDGLDLEIRAGTITALVGPNGAGKSTLIKAWVGFERPSLGRVTVMGVDPFRDRKAVLARVAYVPQSPSLYRELTVADHLDLVETMRHGFDRSHAINRLEQLGIPLSQRAGDLSGGQQAQVSLALALGTGAEILLLDEPLASLDPLARREFLYVLMDAVRGLGRTALLSSHIVTDIEQACDHLVVLGAGRKLLDRAIVEAIAEHAVAVGAPLTSPPPGAVGSFFDPRGHVTLIAARAAPDAEASGTEVRPATLEEVVLGYLAAGRSPTGLDRLARP
jgi:ABC-2 type transport system ATP-binding protein